MTTTSTGGSATAGHVLTDALHPASGGRRRVVVVGGVAGGMSCAARARRLDEHADIVVLERGEHVSFANCGLPYHVGGEIGHAADLLVQTPQSLRDALALDVRVRHEVIGLDTIAQRARVQGVDGSTYALPYDALVLAPGARPVRPPLPGLETSARVHTLHTVEDAVALRMAVDEGARRAVVLGVGFIGVEAAESLARAGVEVTAVELADHVLPPLDAEHAWPVAQELGRIGIRLRVGTAAIAIEPGSDDDTVVLSDGTRLAADMIVLSVGVRPDTAIFQRAGVDTDRDAIIVDEHGRTNVPGVWAVGDATCRTDPVTGIRRPVALAGPANRAGRLVADDIFRPGTARPIPVPAGTAIVRVGDLTVAMTGANRDTLMRAGIPHHTIHLHPNQHAGYFPGATAVHLSVHLRDGDGLILGAQAVGTEGADKRIDVLATAMRLGASGADLIDLDLAYAPPYGQAKDPVNLAGMIAENVKTGRLALWYPWELDSARDTALILDVRRDDEVARGMIPGALHIPHTELRNRLGEVRAAAAGRPVRVVCQSGLRSALAHRMLVQSGFDSASLSGGMLTLTALLGAGADDLLTAPKVDYAAV